MILPLNTDRSVRPSYGKNRPGDHRWHRHQNTAVLPSRKACVAPPAAGQHEGTFSEPRTLFWMQSQLNLVRVMEFPDDPAIGGPLAGCTALMLGKGDVHSVFKPDVAADNSDLYWSNLALVGGLAVEGPIGLLGLGGGAVARTINHFWPERKMQGWEIDPVVAEAGRRHMGMQALEDSGALVCHIGDALAPEASIEGGFAGLVVDLYADGAVLSHLKEEATWRDIRSKLRPGGVVTTNLVVGSEACQAFLAVFSDQEVYYKVRQLNWMAVTGAHPGKLRGMAPGMQAAASDWLPADPPVPAI